MIIIESILTYILPRKPTSSTIVNRLLQMLKIHIKRRLDGSLHHHSPHGFKPKTTLIIPIREGGTTSRCPRYLAKSQSCQGLKILTLNS